jgi:hypothetical protein
MATGGRRTRGGVEVKITAGNIVAFRGPALALGLLGASPDQTDRPINHFEASATGDELRASIVDYADLWSAIGPSLPSHLICENIRRCRDVCCLTSVT